MVIGISGSLDLVKNPDGTDNPCGEFRWSPESQIHSPHLHVGAPVMFPDILKFIEMLKRECGAESNGKLPHPFIPVELQSWFLSLRWKTSLRHNYSLGFCALSEGPALGQSTLIIIINNNIVIIIVIRKWKQRCRWENNIEKGMREVGCDARNYMNLDQDKDHSGFMQGQFTSTRNYIH